MTDTTKILPKLRFPEFENDGEWKVVKLGDIAQFFKGKGISKAEVSNTGTTPCIRYGELYTYYKEVVRDIKSYTNIPTDNLVLSKANDVIIPSSGETKEDISTASCIIEDGIALGGDINIIRSSANGIFLSYYLNNAKKNDIAKIAQGISIIHLYNEQLQNLSIAFPPLPEQQKIAAFLTSLDEQISAHTKKLEALKAHKKGLMQQLFPANGEKTPKLRFPEFKNEREWEEDSMQNIFEIKNGYTPSKANNEYWNNGTIPWFRMEDIRNNGHILSDSIQHITPQAVKGGKLFPAFSIIVATTATIGEHALVIVDSLANQRFTFLTKCKSFDSKLDMLYFHYYMFIVDEWCKLNTNAGGLLSVNMPAFKQLQIPIPSLPEQQKIASFLTSIDEMIQVQNDKIRKLKTYKNGLMQQMFAVETPYYDVSTDGNKPMTPYYDVSTDGNKPMTPYYDVSTGNN